MLRLLDLFQGLCTDPQLWARTPEGEAVPLDHERRTNYFLAAMGSQHYHYEESYKQNLAVSC